MKSLACAALSNLSHPPCGPIRPANLPRAPGGDSLHRLPCRRNGKRVDVYSARVLDPPFAGKEYDYGGNYSFANFDAEPVEVRITSASSLKNTHDPTGLRPGSNPASKTTILSSFHLPSARAN